MCLRRTLVALARATILGSATEAAQGGNDSELDPEQLEKLRTLGYID